MGRDHEGGGLTEVESLCLTALIEFLDTTGSPRRVLCDGLLTFAMSVHALHELFCTNFMGAVQRFDHH